MKWNLFGEKRKDSLFLVLDIGSEAAKALIFSKADRGPSPISLLRGQGNKIDILGTGLEHFANYDIFNSGNFRLDMARETISKAIESARQNLSFSLAKKEIKEKALRQRKFPVLLGLAPTILKARVVYRTFLRARPEERISKKEEEDIARHVFDLGRKEISQQVVEEFGILSKDIEWLSLEFVEVKIDGYPVLDFRGYQGRELEFKLLVTFLPKDYLKKMEKIIFPLGLKVVKIIHIAETLSSLNKDGIFLDIGGEITQVFEIKNGRLQWVDEFKKGGNDFIESLSEKLGIDEDTARSLEKKYSERELTPEVSAKIKEIFLWERKIWYDKLREKLESADIRPFAFFLFGGGSFIPDIRDSLKDSLSIDLKDLGKITDATKSLNNPQYIPSLLLTLFQENE